MKLPSQRHLFDIPDDVTYLNCAYMSPLMHCVRDAGVRGLGQKCRPWEIHTKHFFEGSDKLREAFAELVHASPEDIAIVPAASYGVSTAAKNLPLARGQSVLVVDQQFPSNIYPWRERAKEVGAEVRALDRPEDDDWTTAVLEAIDDTTAILALPHCRWTDGGLFDLEKLSARCRERSIALALDVTQSAGAFPIDVRRIQPDFLTAADLQMAHGTVLARRALCFQTLATRRAPHRAQLGPSKKCRELRAPHRLPGRVRPRRGALRRRRAVELRARPRCRGRDPAASGVGRREHSGDRRDADRLHRRARTRAGTGVRAGRKACRPLSRLEKAGRASRRTSPEAGPSAMSSSA